MPIVAVPDQITAISADTLQVTGVLTDQVSFSLPFNVIFQGTLTTEGIRARLAAQVAATQSQTAVQTVLQVGVPFDLTEPEVVPPPDPTPTEQYQQARFALIQAKEDLDLGLIDQATYDASLQSAQAAKAVVEIGPPSPPVIVPPPNP